MGAAHAQVIEAVQDFLARIRKTTEFTVDTELYADGLGLDSLETAELSAFLEDRFDADPFGADDMPQTVADIVGFYDGQSSAEG